MKIFYQKVCEYESNTNDRDEPHNILPKMLSVIEEQCVNDIFSYQKIKPQDRSRLDANASTTAEAGPENHE